MANQNRRGFIKGAGVALGAVSAIGGGFAAVAMKRAWDPLPSVVAGGITVVDTAGMKGGDIKQVEYRGKPVQILKKMENWEANDARDVVVNGEKYTVIIAICTHLGCIPSWKPTKKIFHCACHGGTYDVNAVNNFGPPPKPMVIPPFAIEGSVISLGNSGPEYEALLAKQV